MVRIAWICLSLMLYGQTHAQLSEVVLSNLLESQDSLTAVGSVGSAQLNNHASPFTTGNSSYYLENVIIDIGNIGGSPSGTFSVFLLSDTAGEPGSQLFQFTGNTAPDNGLFTYTVPASQTLAPNTQYWIATIDVNELTAFGRYTIWRTNSDAETSSFGWTIGNDSRISFTDDVTGPWSQTQAQVLRFSVTASAVPEPATYATAVSLLVFLIVIIRRRLSSH